MKPVLITTEYRGVFAGLIDDNQDITARSMPLATPRSWIIVRWIKRKASRSWLRNCVGCPGWHRIWRQGRATMRSKSW